jgi:hypothetical protein
VEAKEPEQEKEVHEPGGRKHQYVNKMSDEALATAYADGVRFRSHGITITADQFVSYWLADARAELKRRGKLDLIKESLPVYFDPSRKPPVFGPGAEVVSPAAIERAIVTRALKPAG